MPSFACYRCPKSFSTFAALTAHWDEERKTLTRIPDQAPAQRKGSSAGKKAAGKKAEAKVTVKATERAKRAGGKRAKSTSVESSPSPSAPA